MTAPVENLVQRLHARRSGRGWLAKCPAHDDREPSLSIDEGADGRALLKCHAGCATDDVLAALGMTPRDLFPATYPQPSGNGATKVAPLFDWSACVEEFSQKHLERLATWRGYSPEFCSWLHENKLVGLYKGCIAFPVHDCSRAVIGAHYRHWDDDGSWRYPHGIKTAPLIIGELVACQPVHIFESQWDGFAFMDESGERGGIIITRGASNGRLVADAIPERAKVYVWPQNDSAGEKWQRDICANTDAAVKRADIPAPHKDLNEWTLNGGTANDLLAAIVNAETIRTVEGFEGFETGQELKDENKDPFPLSEFAAAR